MLPALYARFGVHSREQQDVVAGWNCRGEARVAYRACGDASRAWRVFELLRRAEQTASARIHRSAIVVAGDPFARPKRKCLAADRLGGGRSVESAINAAADVSGAAVL